jgi:hypothetical protein
MIDRFEILRRKQKAKQLLLMTVCMTSGGEDDRQIRDIAKKTKSRAVAADDSEY